MSSSGPSSSQQRRHNAFRAFFRAFNPSTPGFAERFAAIPRMIKAIVKREYDGGARLVAMVVAALYILSPIDLLPEALLGVFGLIDDAVVLSWLIGTLAAETERFLEWERRRAHVLPGETVDK